MIAILLAGGKGTRLRETGKYFPKPLFPIGAEPVINYLVNKLLNVDDITQIFILSLKEQVIEDEISKTKLDLFNALNKWKEVWYLKVNKVELIFEEDIEDEIVKESFLSKNNQQGAIKGLYKFLNWFNKNKSNDSDQDSFIVMAADNYIEDDLSELMLRFKTFPNSVFNAYFDFSDKEKIRRKYGTIDFDENGWATNYDEKPEDPSLDQTKASTAIYIFPYDQFQILKEYVKNPKYGLDAPGNFLKYLIIDKFPYEESNSEDMRSQNIGVRGYELKGEWFDIGRKSDLMAALSYYIDNYLSEMNYVEDLLLAERTYKLNDKYFLLCHRISINSKEGNIKMFFKPKDKICKLNKDFLGDISTVEEIKSDSSKSIYWSKLNKALVERCEDFDAVKLPLSAPLLISGGVLPRSRTLVPLLEKDPSSPTDPGRLTTPAGRIDMLDLRQVCYAELAEEMIFYYLKSISDSPRIIAISPIEQRDIKRKILKTILRNNVNIPGTDYDKIVFQSRLPEKEIDIVDIIPPSDISLPKEISWTVEFYLEEDCQSICENVVVIPDQKNGTLEFRIACYADITGTPINESPLCNNYSKQVGNLLGIADGDGYSRRPYLISAQSFQRYFKKMHNRDKDKILTYLMDSQQDALEIVASGRPGDGRFESFECKMPLLPFTTSVKYLAQILDYII